ncbi:MAG: hypothetical protein BGO14_05585 [Chlamydiales bacterium 38-26]|nr:hypothetical protein [Chlamydiales bacterium]OJV08371.1 MAG: hypothetical protein BGO14_05585 [Chlamydiales bacterium 38-26]
MPGPITRDSIAKCSPGNDFYSMIRNPTAKIPNKPHQPVDTIDPYRQRLEREATAKIGLFTKNFYVIARAGKFVFLALAIPPYILLFGMPKWVLAEMLPFLIKFTFKIPVAFTKLFKNSASNKGIVHHFQNIWKGISTRASEYIKWIDRSTKALFVHMKHQIVALGYRLLTPYLPIFHRSYSAAEKVTKMLLEKTSQASEQQIKLAKQVVSFAWKVTKQEVLNQLAPYTQMIKKQVTKLRKFIEKRLEKPRLEIQKIKVTIKTKLKQAEEVFKTFGQKINKAVETTVNAITYPIKPLIAWSIPKVQVMMDTFQTGREKLVKSFEQVRSFVQNITSGLLDAARSGRQMAVETTKNIFKIVVPSFIKEFFNPERNFREKYQQSFGRLGKRLKNLHRDIFYFIADTLQKSRKKALIWLKTIQKYFKQILLHIRSLPKRLYLLAVKVYASFIQTSIKTGQFIRRVQVLFTILTRLAWQELKEKAAEIIATIRLTP